MKFLLHICIIDQAFQQRGVPRRLQFEDDLHTEISNQPIQSHPYSGSVKSPLETPQTPVNRKQADTTQYPRNTNTYIQIPKPSGIGLHLNSIVNAVQPGSGAIIHVKSAQRCKLSVRGMKSTPITISHLPDTSNSSSVFTTTEDVPAIPLSTDIVKTSNNSIILNPVDDQSTSGNKRMYSDIETDGYSEEFKSAPLAKRHAYSCTLYDHLCVMIWRDKSVSNFTGRNLLPLVMVMVANVAIVGRVNA